MKRSFKPQVETLESRLVMDAVGTHALYQDLVVPTAPTVSEVVIVASPEVSPLAGVTQSNRLISFRASDPNTLLQMDAPDLAGTQAVTGRITAIVADPSDAQSTAIDNEWRYVPVRRFVSVDESNSQGSAIVFVGGWGSSMYQYSFNDPTTGISAPADGLVGNVSGTGRDGAASTAHHGGANFHFCDGSVRFVSTAIAGNSMNVLLGDASARS